MMHQVLSHFKVPNLIPEQPYVVHALTWNRVERVLSLVASMLQREGSIYLLMTDQGYLQQQAIVWERLSEVRYYYLRSLCHYCHKL